MVRQVIWATLICIIIFNILSYVLISLPTPQNAHYDVAYKEVFGHNFHLLFGFAISFVASDFLNAYALNRWRILLKGKYFWLRSIGSSAVGETLFGIIAAIVIYIGSLSFPEIMGVMFSTWIFKISTSLIVAYPATIVVEILKHIEGINSYNPEEEFCLLKFSDDDILNETIP